MAQHKIEFDCECESCKGTGLYVGLCEKDGFSVICHTCNGTGKIHQTIQYKDFTKRHFRKGVIQVVQASCGICMGLGKTDDGKNLNYDSFGGIRYAEWLKGKNFPNKSEMREFTCPAWFYQSVEYSKKPDWNRCRGFGGFSGCQHFPEKKLCWERWDTEHNNEAIQ